MSSKDASNEKNEAFQKEKEYMENLFKTITNKQLGEIKAFLHNDTKKNSRTMNNIIKETREGKGRNILHFAASRGDLEIFQYLLEEGGDPTLQDSEGNTCLFTAVQHNHINIIKYLLENKKYTFSPRRNKGENATVLHIAASNGSKEIITYILDNKLVGIDEESGVGSPLHWAVTYDQPDAVEILLSKGARNYKQSKVSFLFYKRRFI